MVIVKKRYEKGAMDVKRGRSAYSYTSGGLLPAQSTLESSKVGTVTHFVAYKRPALKNFRQILRLLVCLASGVERPEGYDRSLLAKSLLAII